MRIFTIMKTPRYFPSPFRLLIAIAALLYAALSGAQSCLNLQEQADIPSTCFAMVMTMEHDQLGRPYLYVANKEAGLRAYDISDIQSPALVWEIGADMLEGLEVMNLSQSGHFLYLALGNFFAGNQPPGMAIIDVAEPANAQLRDVWKFSSPSQGAGIVEVEGNYAYLGAMGHGLAILDVSDKDNIEFVSLFTPDITFPDPNPDPLKYNARGLAVKNGLAYLCYDAGGIRIIDVSDKQNPVETARYSNPALNARPRAYNNAILSGELLYVSFDYCGLEILDVSDPENITPLSWWNPWNCQSNPLNWFSSPGHANELALDESCGLLFVSSGKSDLHILDVSDPGQPDSCGYFGGVDNGAGTWGVAQYDNKVFLSYVCSIIPFASNRTGVKALAYEAPCISGLGEAVGAGPRLYPNPASDAISVEWEEGFTGNGKVELYVYDMLGNRLMKKAITAFAGPWRLELGELPDGVYLLVAMQRGVAFGQRVVVMR